MQKIVPDFMCQSGDPSGTGGGGLSIYGPKFGDEISAKRSHDRKGVVSMANFGRNTNSSQFFITFKACPHLDGKHTVFGQVQEKSLAVLEKMQRVKTRSYTPVYPVKLFVAEVLEDPWDGLPLPPGAKIPSKPLIGSKSPVACFLQ
ncbi:hypothetical protein AXG93_3459s1090 [Marchantia polymorpha subsp. ruderalis]|uniref:Peptidyl-prolyl cis-trans isomerase n=1 Tax=Marchantia polymorpha subsp. ruderalis TaxID=1480154 RepID=A0A176W6W1_MARPO|nr:hypothetical protein AXG93_3459s1090 [Marchantia polymorpha subsp. ruderalis]